MAYPTVSAPYGLRPVNLIGGQVFAGATRLMESALTVAQWSHSLTQRTRTLSNALV